MLRQRSPSSPASCERRAVVVETARGRVAAELTDGLDRFETDAVAPPARLRICRGEHAVEHPLEGGQ
ncbi:MAG TPA: hypothetical protein VNO30_17580 [Kofleriaceae bacterium]|nr:hypothetical protein [Kofleriaceae bacterium]